MEYYLLFFGLIATISAYMFGYERGQEVSDIELYELREAAKIELDARDRRKKCQEPIYKPYKPKK